jgi:hypothetical protein
MCDWLHFTVAVLATWRVTHLLVGEDAPGDLLVRLRVAMGESWAGELFDCFYCLSLVIAAPAALFVTRDLLECLFVWLAVSGGACLLERGFPERPAALIEPMTATPPGDVNNVLRTETVIAQRSRGP